MKLKRRRVRGLSLPWMDTKINEAMQDRDHYHRKAIKSNLYFYWSKYRRLRNLVNREIKSANSNDYCNLQRYSIQSIMESCCPNCHRVSPRSLEWFSSYLSNRKQETSCGNELSEALSVTYRVPQGSILGPLLFLVYINELPTAIVHSKVSLYADDIFLYCFAKEPHQLVSKMNADLNNVAMWLKANKLTLNLSKTKSMLIASNRKLTNIFSLPLSLFDCDLDSLIASNS